MIAPEYLLGSGVIDITVGKPADQPVAVSPRGEVVASSRGDNVGPRDEPFRGPYGWHSLQIYRRMDDCPAVGASFNALRSTVLSGKIDLISAVSAEAAEKLGQDHDAEDLIGVEADMAKELLQSNRRMMQAWETPIDLVLWEAMDAMKFGNQIAEKVCTDIKGGPDDGLWNYKSLKFKDGCNYVVDRAMNVVGIKAQTFKDDGTSAYETLPPEHFAWLTWDAYKNDPRGRSCYKMAVDPWRRLESLWPKIQTGFEQFGVPNKVGILPPGAVMVPATDERGNVIPGGKAKSPNQAMADAIKGLENGASAAFDNGADVKVVESNKDSSVAATGVALHEAQIVKAILLQTRATVEAKFGSRADSETGQDIMGAMVRFIRKWLERYVRALLMYLNTLNYGPDIARRCTPLVDLGSTEHQDFAANAAGVATLFQSSYFTEGQLPQVDSMLGLPQRSMGESRVGPNGIMPTAQQAQVAAATPAPAGGAA